MFQTSQRNGKLTKTMLPRDISAQDWDLHLKPVLFPKTSSDSAEVPGYPAASDKSQNFSQGRKKKWRWGCIAGCSFSFQWGSEEVHEEQDFGDGSKPALHTGLNLGLNSLSKWLLWEHMVLSFYLVETWKQSKASWGIISIWHLCKYTEVFLDQTKRLLWNSILCPTVANKIPLQSKKPSCAVAPRSGIHRLRTWTFYLLTDSHWLSCLWWIWIIPF